MDLNTLIFSLSFFLIESRLSIVLILKRGSFLDTLINVHFDVINLLFSLFGIFLFGYLFVGGLFIVLLFATFDVLLLEDFFLTLIDFLNVEGSLFLSNALIIWLTLILSLLTHLLVVIFDVLL